MPFGLVSDQSQCVEYRDQGCLKKFVELEELEREVAMESRIFFRTGREKIFFSKSLS